MGLTLKKLTRRNQGVHGFAYTLNAESRSLCSFPFPQCPNNVDPSSLPFVLFFFPNFPTFFLPQCPNNVGPSSPFLKFLLLFPFSSFSSPMPKQHGPFLLFLLLSPSPLLPSSLNFLLLLPLLLNFSSPLPFPSPLFLPFPFSQPFLSFPFLLLYY